MLNIEELHVKLEDFNLSIDSLSFQGRKNFLMGKNGSGKTTFLKSIAGIVQTKSGRISINDREISSLPSWKRKVSYIPQDLLLFPTLNVKDNIRISIKHGSGSEEIYRNVIEKMDLPSILEKKVWQISGGQAQRVAVARSLVSDPELLLMDEPFSMQDERARAQMLSILYTLMEDLGFSFLYVTHNIRDLEFGYDSINFFESGKIIESVSCIDDISKFSSYSMIDYRNTIKTGGKYYKVSEGSFHFSDKTGLSYKTTEFEKRYIIKVQAEGEDFFITSSKRPDGKYLVISEKDLVQLE